ncbi:Serine/threonine protein phosphatase 5 [Spironucleus salmonicida]|uniref:Serine/threonine protein phosphatase 5 n=1 Tax=Spironucleus salmonicida TaxID=348837 RepID=V6M814_9EUKA|nr:Serine/threonine protein phosphatase 5 [Spironucleus salmonicida]KAH0573260.1 Serine/threonine protein phosphatase 5 [Spironucleus salmonicida]|eukprot:EST49619.1 hypothetical protein SS50377_10002 [Spironucleus salmonicida]
MDIQIKIKQQAEKQHQIMNDLTQFISKQEIVDKKASEEVKQFNGESIILPAPRGTVDINQDAKFEKSRGNQFFKDKKFKEAAECYEVALNSDDAIIKSQSYFNLGLCFQKLNRKPMESLACFQSALSLDPTYAKARQRYSKSLMENQMYQEAYEQLVELNDPKNEEDMALCRQKLGATKVQILEGSTSSDDEVDVQINKNIDVPRKININLKKQELMTVTDASLLNQEILGSVNGKLVYRDDVILHEKASALDFFSRFRDFVQEPNILLKFLDQFHTVQLQKYFENIQRQVTPKDLTQLLLACKYGQKIMTISKMINMLYNISDIDGVNKMVRLLPSDEMIIIEEIIRFFNTWIEIECTDDKKGLYKERVLCIAESWLNE